MIDTQKEIMNNRYRILELEKKVVDLEELLSPLAARQEAMYGQMIICLEKVSKLEQALKWKGRP